MTIISLQEVKKINYWDITTFDAAGGFTPWHFIAKGSPDNIIKQIINEGHDYSFGFTFTPLKESDFFEKLDLTQLRIINEVKLNLEVNNKRFELSLWLGSGLNERGNETFYHYQKDLFPSLQGFLVIQDFISSENGEVFSSPMRRPGTCEYRIP